MTEIDVSGCKLRTENNEMACFVICNEYPDCYYKKLKRLEQKLEKIKEIATKYSQREDYLLGGLFADLVDKLNEALKDERRNRC